MSKRKIQCVRLRTEPSIMYEYETADRSSDELRRQVQNIENNGRTGTSLCDDVADHVHQCMLCQRRLSFDPIEKALLKSHSMKNEITEFLAFMMMGFVVIASLWIVGKVRRDGVLG